MLVRTLWHACILSLTETFFIGWCAGSSHYGPLVIMIPMWAIAVFLAVKAIRRLRAPVKENLW